MLIYDTVCAFSKNTNTQNTDKNERNACLTTAIPCLRSLKSKVCASFWQYPPPPPPKQKTSFSSLQLTMKMVAFFSCENGTYPIYKQQLDHRLPLSSRKCFLYTIDNFITFSIRVYVAISILQKKEDS